MATIEYLGIMGQILCYTWYMDKQVTSIYHSINYDGTGTFPQFH
jgi:hypothetical protein